MSRYVALKRRALVRYGLGQPPPLATDGVPIIRATNIYRGRIVDDDLIRAKLADLPVDRAPLLRCGEVLVVRSGAYTGDSALVTSQWEGAAPGYDLRITPGTGLEPRFLAYSLLGQRAADQIALDRSRAAQPHLNAADLGGVEILDVSMGVQRAIADYLDRETARIDALIEKKRKMMELAQESSDGILLQVLAPSSVVPQIPLRRVLRKLARPPSGDIVTVFRDGHVMLRSRRRDDGFTESDTQFGYQGVRRGDIVFHGLDAFAGAIGIAEDDGMCTPVYHVCASMPGIDAQYVAMALRALALSGFLMLQAGNVRERAVDFRNWMRLAQIVIPLPNGHSDIARRYKARSAWAESVVSMVRHQITLLRERRQALITAAVTGQVDIAAAA